MVNQSLLLVILLIAIRSQPTEDLVSDPPGMPNASKIYSGYLDTLSETRKLHYVLVESEGKPESDPLVLWLGGGPGCSSLIGFLKEIGPYIVGNSYENKTNLTRNQYSWSKSANLLFIDSPAGVGFSTNSDHTYVYNDTSTVEDLYAALKYFLGGKGDFWSKSVFYVAGQDYAGKYIPDLVVKILNNNANFYINITGILVGNGVMVPHQHEMQKTTIEYMNKRSFINPTMMGMYKQSCEKDYHSPRCGLFRTEYYTAMARVNPYNVYDVCRPHDSIQASQSLSALPECFSFEGMVDYLNMHREQFNVKNQIRWTYCSSNHYIQTPSGSIDQYKAIILNKRVKIWMYNGDSDNQYPLEDTLKNLPKVGSYEIGSWNPWKKDKHHAGFYIHYSNVLVVSVKGAGVMVPMDKREASYQMFYNFINNREIDEPVS